MKARFLLPVLFCLLPAPAFALPWSVIPGQSTFTFTATQMGQAFTGVVQKYQADIDFDPDKAAGRVTVDIDIASLGTGDKDRDRTIPAPEWFDTPHFPAARFAADSFRKTGPGAFEAEGTLTIKGISVPVAVPFTFEKVEGSALSQARVKGHVTLDRSKFRLGTGDWADTSVIANEVAVDFTLVALPKK